MNTFVGAEYVMANTLIALKRKGEESITFERLREIGFQIQTYEKKTIFCCTSAAIAPKNIACYEINADFVFGISNQSKCQRFFTGYPGFARLSE